MIFPVLEIEDIVQVGDQTRLNAVKSFVSKDEESISKVEISPDDGTTWIDVTGDSEKDWFLDWQFDGITRDQNVKVRVTTDGAPTEITKIIKVISVDDDKLFSVDTDLIALEPDILKYVALGRASFLNVHRMAQTKILESLDESGVTDVDCHKPTKASVVDVSEVRAWSRDLVLHLIFKSLINSVDDVFVAKSAYYAKEVGIRKGRAITRLDLNNDGELECDEGVSSMSMDLVRR